MRRSALGNAPTHQPVNWRHRRTLQLLRCSPASRIAECQVTMARAAPTAEQSASKLDTLYDGFKKSFSEVPEISVQTLHEWTQDSQGQEGPPPLLVDVRTQAEQQVSVLPGANTMTQSEFEGRGLDAARGRRVVCYCTAGYRSGLFADKLRRKHGIDSFNLRGGILAWTQAGYPLTDPRNGATTSRVHVFSKDWALQGEGYEPVMFQRPLARLAVDAAGGWLRSGLRMLRGGGGGKRRSSSGTVSQQQESGTQEAERTEDSQ